MKALFTEEEMQNVDRLRHKGHSWRKIENLMWKFYKINHHYTTFMRHYKKWQYADKPYYRTGTDAVVDNKPGILDRLMWFFGF